MTNDIDRLKLFSTNSNFGDKYNFIWDYAEVVDVNDPYDAGRIRVRIPTVDIDTTIQNQLSPPEEGGLPWCEPLLPKYLNLVPEVGQLVKVIAFDTLNKKLRRQYIGPVIGQQTPRDFLRPDFFDSKLKVENSAYVGKWSDNPNSSALDWKIYPEKTDVAFLGRRNTDIILRNKSFFDEIQLRAGKINPNTLVSGLNSAFRNSPVELNKKNPGYITINFTEASGLQQEGVNNVYKNLNLQKDRSHVNIVADHINFISHLGSNSSKNKTETVNPILQGGNISEQINVENTQLHPVVYGDVLWEFLELLRSYITGHVHKGPGKTKPDANIVYENIVKWFDDNMGGSTPKQRSINDFGSCTFLSKGVRTN